MYYSITKKLFSRFFWRIGFSGFLSDWAQCAFFLWKTNKPATTTTATTESAATGKVVKDTAIAKLIVSEATGSFYLHLKAKSEPFQPVSYRQC
jgi:hypothetical protein